MRFEIVSLLSLAAMVVGDANTVLADLKTLTSDLNTLDSDLGKVSSGILGIGPTLQVNYDTLVVDNDIVKTTADVNAANKFTASESSQIITSVNTLVAQSNKTISDLIAKNSTFFELAPVVLASLHAISDDQNNLAYALAGKLDNSAINQGVADLVALQNSINLAIAAFGGGTTYYG